MKIRRVFYQSIICCILLLVIMINDSAAFTFAKSKNYTADEMEKMIDGTLSYQQKLANTSSIQELIDHTLTDQAGSTSSDWLIIALSRYNTKYSYTNYISALETYADKVTDAKATDLQRIALVFSAAQMNTSYITDTIKSTVDELGVMSEIYGLILMDSGEYPSNVSREDIILKLLDLRLSDGGWALNGKTSDIDITAMVLQALAPYLDHKDVKKAVDQAVKLLSKRQLNTGDYKSWGIRCCESTAQVITALSALGIDVQKDSRFIKKQKSLLDGLLLYKKADGSFSHTIDGKTDNTASVQAMYSLIAAWRQKKGLSSFYDFRNQDLKDQNEILLTDQTASPTPTLTSSASGTNSSTNSSHPDVRVIITTFIFAASLLSLAILFIMKKRKRKNYITILAVTVLAVTAVWLIKLQSPEEYYHSNAKGIQTSDETVWLSIRCDTVAGKNKDIPINGIILDKTELPLGDGDTVLDVLLFVTKQKKIPLDYTGESGVALNSAYIKGINNLYEDDYGDQSGWLYSVNGEFPGTACGDYQLKNQDVVEWVYTCDLGKDVGRE